MIKLLSLFLLAQEEKIAAIGWSSSQLQELLKKHRKYQKEQFLWHTIVLFETQSVSNNCLEKMKRQQLSECCDKNAGDFERTSMKGAAPMSLIGTSRSLVNMWEKLHIEKDFRDVPVSQDILDSWERSRTYGIDQFKRCNQVALDHEAFKKRLNDNKQILDVVLPAIETLYHVTKGAGFLVVFVDADGYILKRVGNQSDIETISYSNFIEGTKWTEDIMGTNAIGLALVTDKPVQVYGYEHFCKHNCLATCSAAPIHDSKGNIIGVIDLSGRYENTNAHTLGMAVSASKSIEREIELNSTIHMANKLFKEAELLNLNIQAILNAMSEGLISVDRNEIITTINAQAINMLEITQIDSSFWVGKHISEILEFQKEFLQQTIQFKRKYFAENMSIKVGNKKERFLVNCTPYKDKLDDNETNGAVIILNKSNTVINKIFGATAKASFEDLIGQNSNFLKAIDQAKMAAETSSNVLLTGESGVGKDLFAQAIHNASRRKAEPFLGINCAAIPRELISSELFGYEEGAFTGARKGGNSGKFELADRGTIFLDEIAEMPLDLQVSLLRVLEERTIIRLGGREFIPVNVRVVAATNKDLPRQIEKGTFRSDLFFRLNVIQINLPPLRERKGDIPLLVEHFVRKLSQSLGKNIKDIEPEVLDCLINYDWPGNIRELNNTVERAINLCKNNVLTLDLISEDIKEATMAVKMPKWRKSMLQEEEENERQLIEYFLAKEDNNRTKVAELLKISRSSLYRKIRKYAIE